MEGNFLSRYNNKIEEWTELIKNDPENRKKYAEWRKSQGVF